MWTLTRKKSKAVLYTEVGWTRILCTLFYRADMAQCIARNCTLDYLEDVPHMPNSNEIRVSDTAPSIHTW